MYGKNRRSLRSNKNTSTTHSSLPELNFIASRAMNAINSLLSFCGTPSSSDDESSPKNRSTPTSTRFCPSEPAMGSIASSANTQMSNTPKLAVAVEALVKEEETVRQSIDRACDAKLLQTEALFCATTQKKVDFQQETAGRNTLFSQQLFFRHLPVATAIQTEEEQARADLEIIFKDDSAIAESTTTSKKSWGEWSAGLLRR